MFDESTWAIYRVLRDSANLHDSSSYPIARTAMVSIMTKLRKELPSSAKYALDIAEKFDNGLVSRSDLIEQHEAVWGLIVDREQDDDDKFVCLIRALAYALLPDLMDYPDDSPDDLITDFLDWLQRAQVSDGIVQFGLRLALSKK